MTLTNFIWYFFNEVISHNDNTPTKLSVLMYAYFQMLYNFGTLFDKSQKQSTDRVLPLKNYKKIRADLLPLHINQFYDNILLNYLYIGHNAFLSQLYGTTPLSQLDYGFTPYQISSSITSNLINWSKSHITEKAVELTRAGFSTANIYGLPADYQPSHDSNQYWIQLQVPTGKKLGTNGLPEIDPADPTTYKIQNFLGKDFYLNTGFAVDPTSNIINLSRHISTNWETGLKEQMDLILAEYENLTDTKKMTAELFAGSSKGVLPPPGFFIVIAIELSQKYKQSIQNDLIMFFSLACGLFDAAVSAWYYKSTYNQGRPISLIRNNYTNDNITSWSPTDSSQTAISITGSQWLPYQNLNFVTPPFPDVASGHTTFSRVAGKILNWWFNNPVLYDGFTTIKMPNSFLICPSLNNMQKECLIGEFILQKGSSTIEPNITPKTNITLIYKTLEELYLAAGISRVYGGIHSFQTNEVSGMLADWVYTQTYNKLINLFRFTSPYDKVINS